MAGLLMPVGAKAATKMRFVTPFNVSLSYSSVFYAKVGGFFEKEGLDVEVINGKGGYPIVYQRGDSNERFVVALNPAGQPGEVEITLPGAARLVTVFADKAEASLDNDRAILRMEGVSFGIFEVHFQ